MGYVILLWHSLSLPYNYLGRSSLGLKMGKFCQLSPELWPLVDVRNSFLLSIFAILGMKVDIAKGCFGIADGFDLRVMALD